MRIDLFRRVKSTFALIAVCLAGAGMMLAQAGGGTLSRDSGANAGSTRHTTERARPPVRRQPSQTRVAARSAQMTAAR